MKFLPDELLEQLKSQKLTQTDDHTWQLPDGDSLLLVKFFLPDSDWRWYAVSAVYDEHYGQPLLFGFVHGRFDELGCLWLSELSDALGPLGFAACRDLAWIPKSLNEVRRTVTP